MWSWPDSSESLAAIDTVLPSTEPHFVEMGFWTLVKDDRHPIVVLLVRRAIELWTYQEDFAIWIGLVEQKRIVLVYRPLVGEEWYGCR